MSQASDYKRTEVIGQGKFGIVYKGFHRQTKKVVAIKVLELDTQYDEVVDVQQEIQFLADLKNAPNVTHYYGSFLIDTKLWIIMDYCAGGSVRTLLKAGSFEEKYISIIVRETLQGLVAVHKLGVIHRDLKAANILITNEGNVQLCDFGVAAQLTANSLKRTTMAGTPFWMAPEVIREGDQYNVKADIWSLGITIYEIATGNPPYCEKGSNWAMAMIAKLKPPRLEGREYPPALKECIALCLDENPTERPFAEDLLKCKLVKQYKNVSTGILKELISRYLMWRDRNSSRDSVFVSVDQESTASYQDKDQIQVKWDFDSLSSREYIIENDIHINDTLEHFPNISDENERQNETITANNQVTRSRNTSTTNAHQHTLTDSRMHSSPPTAEKGSTGTRQLPHSSSTNIPKSLISLFEDEPEEENENHHPFDLPRMPALQPVNEGQRLESPTIEIPDMESMAKISSAKDQHLQQLSQSRSQANSLHPRVHLNLRANLQDGLPHLNKPPALIHSQSASAALEPRLGSPSTSRPRKKTISNSYGPSPIYLNSDQASPLHQHPHAASADSPSPMGQPASLASVEMNSSPSKSMRALHSNNNPLLQPINFKLGGDGSAHPNNSSHTSTVHSGQNTANGATLGQNTGAALASSPSFNHEKPKREKPSLRIQMPVPNSSMNLMSALTSEELKHPPATAVAAYPAGENVNQFGINPALVGNMTSMTPVTEKDSQLGDSIEGKDSSVHRNGSQLVHKKTAVLQGPKTAPISSSITASNYFLPRNTQQPASSVASSTNAHNAAKTASQHGTRNQLRFPAIPAVNPELFSDSTPKARLAGELENMFRLFSQSLDVLEQSLQ